MVSGIRAVLHLCFVVLVAFLVHQLLGGVEGELLLVSGLDLLVDHGASVILLSVVERLLILGTVDHVVLVFGPIQLPPPNALVVASRNAEICWLSTEEKSAARPGYQDGPAGTLTLIRFLQALVAAFEFLQKLVIDILLAAFGVTLPQVGEAAVVGEVV